MTAPFKIDGVSYNITVPENGIKRSAKVTDGPNAGRSISTGAMIRDIIGTYYNYTIELATQRLEAVEYDRLYETITAPVDYHTVVVPYGQKTLTFRAYITSAEDALQSMDEENYWTGLTMSFIAMAPQRTA